MNSSRQLLVLAMLWLSAFAALAQETAGRIIAAVGDVIIERDGMRLPATTGAPVMPGDQLVLGPESNAQIRLSDESIIALRPETIFKLTEYAFQGQAPENQRSAFDLVKGGMRTVTGLIGRATDRTGRYRVTTPTATIGIRGTHYSLVHCDGGCRGANGAVAPNGTYGAVTDGRIAVSNQSGERVFGADQYFQVRSSRESPQQLIAPPPFLRDRLEGRARAKERQQANQQARAQGGAAQQSGQQSQGSQTSGTQGSSSSGSTTSTSGSSGSTGSESATTVAQTGLGATTGDTGLAGSVTSPAPIVAPSTTTLNTFVTNETQTAGGVASTVQSGFNGTIFYRLAGPFSIPISCSNPPCGTLTAGDIVLGVNFAVQRAFVRLAVQDVSGERINVGVPFDTGGIPITVANGAITFSGSANAADYPTQQGFFRCSNCGAGSTVGVFNSISASGTISGSVASLTFTVSDGTGSSTIAANLSQTALPNTDGAAIVAPRSGGGADARSDAYWNVTLDASRRLTTYGPPVGQIKATVGSASNIIIGSNAAAGNLVWGHWSGAGANITDYNYVNFNTAGGASVPWITGTVTNTLSPTLGTVTYGLVGGLVNGGAGSVNSGAITADFVNRTMSLSLNATSTSSGNTFQMNGSSGIAAVNGRFSAGFSSVTCSGPCVGGTPSGSFGGFFAGTQAEGAGVGFSAGFGLGTGVNGVAAFKR